MKKSVKRWSLWSKIFGVVGIVLPIILAIFGDSVLPVFLALVVAAGWLCSFRESNIKDEQLKTFKLKSKTAISEANARAAKANKKAAETRKKASQLEKEAAEAKLELTKLQVKLEPRKVTPAQFEILDKTLNGVSRGKITLCVSFGSDPISVQYMETMNSALRALKYEVSSAVVPGKIMPGNTLLLKEHNSPPWAAKLQEAFAQAEIQLVTMIDPRMNDNEVIINIGPKPELLDF